MLAKNVRLVFGLQQPSLRLLQLAFSGLKSGVGFRRLVFRRLVFHVRSLFSRRQTGHFRRMSHDPAFHEIDQIFGDVGGMVGNALQMA